MKETSLALVAVSLCVYLHLFRQIHSSLSQQFVTVTPSPSVLHFVERVQDLDEREPLSLEPDLPDCYTKPARVPSFILAGAQKAGTSALYYLLQEVDGISPSLNFEPHFFDKRGELGRFPQVFEQNQTRICEARRHYWEFFNTTDLRLNPNSLAFEKTPVYLCVPWVPALIRAIVPWPKIVIVLRNPVDRAFSAYGMYSERVENETKFKNMEVTIGKNVKQLRRRGLSHAPAIDDFVESETFYNSSHFWPPASHTLRDFPGLMQSLVVRGFYAEQLRIWLEHYELGKDLMVVHYESFLQDKANVLNNILSFLGAQTPHNLPASVLDTKYEVKRNPKYRAVPPMAESTRRYLERFYEPYNRQLAHILGHEWKNVWPPAPSQRENGKNNFPFLGDQEGVVPDEVFIDK